MLTLCLIISKLDTGDEVNLLLCIKLTCYIYEVNFL